MTVKEFLEKLQEFDPNSEVLFSGGYNSILDDNEYPEVTDVSFFDEWYDGYKYKFNVVVID